MTTKQASRQLATMTLDNDLADFAAILVEGDAFHEPEAILDYIRKPWKWAPEYAAWINAGRPQPSDTAWDAFADKLTALLTS